MAIDRTIFFEESRIGNVRVLRLVAKKILDNNCVEKLSEALFAAAHDDGKNILLNFETVEYLLSTMVGTFIELERRLSQDGGKLVLCNLNPNIYEVFRISKLPETITTFPS